MTDTNRLGQLRWRRAIPALLVAALFAVAAIAGDAKGKIDGQDAQPDAPAKAVAVAEQAPDAVLLAVDGKNVTRADVDRALEAGLGMHLSSLAPEQRAQVREQFGAKAEEQVIDELLLAAAAEKEKLLATSDEVDAALARIKEGLPKDASVEDELRKAGLTEETLRSEIARNLGIEKLLRRATDAVTEPSAEEVERFYKEHPEHFRKPESVEARHILFAVDPKAGDEAKAKAKAEEVRELLVKDPSRFAELAKEHSACPSGKKGGDLGRFERGEMAPEFEAAAFARKPGEIGAVVESPYGFHIIQVQSHETESAVSLEEARPSIVLHLRDESRRDAMEKHVRSLRDGAKITRMMVTGS